MTTRQPHPRCCMGKNVGCVALSYKSYLLSHPIEVNVAAPQPCPIIAVTEQGKGVFSLTSLFKLACHCHLPANRGSAAAGKTVPCERVLTICDNDFTRQEVRENLQPRHRWQKKADRGSIPFHILVINKKHFYFFMFVGFEDLQSLPIWKQLSLEQEVRGNLCN